MKNLEFILKRGEVGKVLHFTLSDENGLVDLDDKDIFLTAKKGTSEPAIDEAECEADADQDTNKGEGTFTFDSTTAGIAVGTYNLEFKVVDELDNVYYFPLDKNKPFGKLVVVEPLG